MIRVAVTGSLGRMGSTVVGLLSGEPDMVLAAALERDGHDHLGVPVGPVRLSSSLEVDVDVLIDFSSPVSTMSWVEACRRRHVALVVGTTGLDAGQQARLVAAGSDIPVLAAPNMSLGVNLLFELAPRIAEALGSDFDVEIVEAHHRHKADAPSGTAVRLLERLAAARGLVPGACVCHGRSGQVGARASTEIGVHAVRGGDVVGDHTVHYAGPGERIELTHRASSRETFARGAIRAARWLSGRAPGVYEMRQVLGL